MRTPKRSPPNAKSAPNGLSTVIPLIMRTHRRLVYPGRCLFPPFTMLSVLEPEEKQKPGETQEERAGDLLAAPRLSHSDSMKRAARAEEYLAEECSHGEKTFLRIKVRPSFV